MNSSAKPAGPKSDRCGTVRFRNSRWRCRLDYTTHLECLIRLWCQRYPQLQHVDMDRVVVSLVKCRSARAGGFPASITSLRYQGGVASSGREVIRLMPRLLKNDREALYLLRFHLPRFHDLPVAQKVSVILHELFHVHPKFNGEFRNFGGRHWLHGPSRRAFEEMFDALKSDILLNWCPLYDLFLDCTFDALMKRFGSIYGNRCRFGVLLKDRTATVA